MNGQGREYNIQGSRVSLYTPLQLYSLVSDIEHYPEFLPWCRGARIKEKTSRGVIAELTVGFGPVQASFTTNNRNEPGKSIQMELVEGPFKKMEGAWHFRSGKDGKSRVSLDLNFQFANRRMDRLFDPVFKKIITRIIDAFEERAGSLYGSPGID